MMRQNTQNIEQIEESITPPLKNYNERLHNINLFNPKIS